MNALRATSAALVVAFVVMGFAQAAVAQGPPPGRGRPVTATGNQALAFGTVFPGVPTTISRTDALNSGQFQIRGANNAQVQVTFTLPAAFTGPNGASMPLVFGAGDGGYSQSPTIGTATGFDPRIALLTTLSQQGRLYLFLGGRVVPPAQQTPGVYSATITVTVSYTN